MGPDVTAKRQAGFTLVEVLVALAIVAIALAAGLQSTTALTNNALRQTSTLLAQMCAENELVNIRLSRQMPDVGEATSTCEQAGRSFPMTTTIASTPNPSFRRVDAQVFENGYPILRISTVAGRY